MRNARTDSRGQTVADPVPERTPYRRLDVGLDLAQLARGKKVYIVVQLWPRPKDVRPSPPQGEIIG